VRGVLCERAADLSQVTEITGRHLEVIDLRGRTMVATDNTEIGNLPSALALASDVGTVEQLSVEASELLEKLIQPKPVNMTRTEAEAWRDGYDRANREMQVFRGIYDDSVKETAAAHKAWVTMREWAYAVSRKAFTHDVVVMFHPDMGTYRDKAVSEEHARSLVRKAKAQHRTEYTCAAGKRLPCTVQIRPIKSRTRPAEGRLAPSYSLKEAAEARARIDADLSLSRGTRAAIKAHVTRRTVS
jgi:hypothetical protein